MIGTGSCEVRRFIRGGLFVNERVTRVADTGRCLGGGSGGGRMRKGVYMGGLLWRRRRNV